MAEHIDDNAAAVFLPVVPRRALGGLAVVFTGEYPVAELAAHAQDAPEEPLVSKELEFANAGEPELVLHDAIFEACIFAELGQAQGFGCFHGGWLLAVNGLARLNGAFDESCPLQCAAGIEKDLVVRIGEGGVDIGRELLYPCAPSKSGEFVVIPSRLLVEEETQTNAILSLCFIEECD